MRYLFLVYGDESRLRAMSAHQRAAFRQACAEGDALLRESGYALAAWQLSGNEGAVGVQFNQGQLAVCDDALSLAHDQLAAVILIEAHDLNEAIHLAGNMPQARGGPIEIRSVAPGPVSDYIDPGPAAGSG